MQFSDVRKEMESITFDTLRVDADDYFEAVITNGEIAKLTPKLERLFNLPAPSPQEELPSKVKKVIQDFGGIGGGQTLYFADKGENVIFAMLWPWSDGRHTTVKIAEK